MQYLIQAQNLLKHFSTPWGVVHAVDDVSFRIEPGETIGLVGESGCGKTTVGRTILKLIEPDGGKLLFKGRDIFSMEPGERQKLRRELAIVFQDPYSSLNPRLKVADLVAEPLKTHTPLRGAGLRDRVNELLEQVGLKPEHSGRFPHQFSGGQRQRIAIARALALDPAFLVFDEPTSALDVSVQAQVLNLIRALQVQKKLTYLFISHDLLVIQHISDWIMVMYLGKLVESGPVEDVFAQPFHPYTEALLASAPRVGYGPRHDRPLLDGEVPSPVNPPPGCRFHTRCRYSRERCRIEEPEMRYFGRRRAACHFAEPLFGAAS